jgi:hypothetical protein
MVSSCAPYRAYRRTEMQHRVIMKNLPTKSPLGTGEMTQVAEHLPSKGEALSSNSSAAKKEKKVMTPSEKTGEVCWLLLLTSAHLCKTVVGYEAPSRNQANTTLHSMMLTPGSNPGSATRTSCFCGRPGPSPSPRYQCV